jgi:hypothetical protein
MQLDGKVKVFRFDIENLSNGIAGSAERTKIKYEIIFEDGQMLSDSYIVPKT